MCLAGAVVAPWSLTQGVAGLNPFTVMNSVKTFRKNSDRPMVMYHEYQQTIGTFKENNTRFLNIKRMLKFG